MLNYIGHRNVQLYDGTFVSWGFDKVTQIYGMNPLDYKLNVLPDLYIIHLNHMDIKGYKDWFSGHLRDKRHNLKIGTSSEQVEERPWPAYQQLLS